MLFQVSVTTETITPVHAKTASDPAFKGMGFGSVLKETITPAYAARPSPATHAISIHLKAGETVHLMDRVQRRF